MTSDSSLSKKMNYEIIEVTIIIITIKNMKKIIITSPPNTGKSTALNKIVQLLIDKKEKITGFITNEILDENNLRAGFELININTNETTLIASLSVKSDHKFGKWFLFPDNIKNFLTNIEISKEGIMIIDEIAPMQLSSKHFCEFVIKCFDSDLSIIATIKKDDCGEGLIYEIKKKKKY